MLDPNAFGDVEREQLHLAREISGLLMDTRTVETFMQHIAEIAVATIHDDVSASVTVARDGHPTTVASSDAFASQFDEVQYGPDEGPCLTAMRAGTIVLIEDMATDERFNQYRDRALALGVRSSMSLPLCGGTEALGALNLYSRRAHSFGPREQHEAQRFAGEASRALSLAVRLVQGQEISDQLREALTSRAVIDQALGIIMGQNRCPAHEAFAVLRHASQNRNVKLHTIAAEMVTNVGHELPSLGHAFED